MVGLKLLFKSNVLKFSPSLCFALLFAIRDEILMNARIAVVSSKKPKPLETCELK